MHLITPVEGYSPDVREWQRQLTHRLYKAENKQDGMETFYSPAVREFKLFDVVVPEQIADAVVKDINSGAVHTHVKAKVVWKKRDRRVPWDKRLEAL